MSYAISISYLLKYFVSLIDIRISEQLAGQYAYNSSLIIGYTSEAKTDSLTIAGAVLITIIAFAAFKFMRRGVI